MKYYFGILIGIVTIVSCISIVAIVSCNWTNAKAPFPSTAIVSNFGHGVLYFNAESSEFGKALSRYIRENNLRVTSISPNMIPRESGVDTMQNRGYWVIVEQETSCRFVGDRR